MRVHPSVPNKSERQQLWENNYTLNSASSWSIVHGTASLRREVSSSSSSSSQSDSDWDMFVDNDDDRDSAGVANGGGAETI